MNRRRAQDQNKNHQLACVILAAGKGTRMNSERPKMLHPVLGVPMVSYAVERAQELGADPIIAVLGHQRELVGEALAARHGTGAVTVVKQAVQRGTGHAVKLALKPLSAWDGLVLILSGDVPLLRKETLEALVAEARRTAGLAFLATRPEDPRGYGRVVRDAAGNVLRIVETKDAKPSERKIGEVNGGVYAAPAGFLRKATARLRPQNAQGEYYLTDVVASAVDSVGVSAVSAAPEEVAGINDRRQLAAAERLLCWRVVSRWMEHATFRDPDTVYVEAPVTIEPDVEIGRNVSLRGRTRIGRGARIDDGAILTDTTVAAGAVIKPYSIATEAVIGPGAMVGPFAHLRPGSELGPDTHVGNFVETKKTRLGRGSKANHLTYLGDTTIGKKVNIGAGTITCNYNGYEKARTVIEDGAFIGSDTQLVAPVRVGRRAVVAAGTTVTTDVPDGALAVSRVPQVHKAGYADKVAARYRDKSNSPSRLTKATRGSGR